MHFPRAHEKSGMVAHAALYSLLSNHPWRVRCGALEIVVYAQTDVVDAFRNGVGDVKYTIVLSQCDKFLISESQLFKTLSLS